MTVHTPRTRSSADGTVPRARAPRARAPWRAAQQQGAQQQAAQRQTGQRGTVPRGAASWGTVPWWTVLSLAAVMAFGDGFVMVALRGAFGAVERTPQPFVSWFLESTLAVPLYALVVLEVLTRVLGRSGPTLTSARPVVRTAITVALAGSVLGVVWLGATAAYDFRLQKALVQHMSSMRVGCVTNCLELQQNSTWRVVVEALLIGSALLVATNVVLVGWVVALRGGRLRAAGRGVALRGDPTATARRHGGLTGLIGVGLLGTAAIHLASVVTHRSGGVVVLLLGTAEIVLAAVLLAGPRVPRQGWTVGVIVASTLPLLWRGAGGVGLPVVSPGGAGVPAAVAAVLELGTLIGAVALILGRGRRAPTTSPHDRALVVLAVVALAGLGVTATTPAWTVDPGSVGSVSHPAGAH